MIGTILIVVGVAVVLIGGGFAFYIFRRKKTPALSDAENPQPQKQTQAAELRTLLDPTEKYLLPLIEKEEISHDTRRFRLGLPSPNHVLGLPVGQHIQLVAEINGDQVARSYTPVTSDDDKGYVDLVIKVYKRDVHPKFPEGGKMSQHVDSLQIGDQIAVRGPKGRLQYRGNGSFSLKELPDSPQRTVQVSKVNLIAGGTGIAPMLQLIRDVLKHPEDKTELRLLFANQTEDDILLRTEIEEVAAKFPGRFQFWYTLDRPSEGWQYSSGFINDDMIAAHLFEPAEDTLTLMCGPPPMIKFACVPALENLGYSADRRFAY